MFWKLHVFFLLSTVLVRSSHPHTPKRGKAKRKFSPLRFSPFPTPTAFLTAFRSKQNTHTSACERVLVRRMTLAGFAFSRWLAFSACPHFSKIWQHQTTSGCERGGGKWKFSCSNCPEWGFRIGDGNPGWKCNWVWDVVGVINWWKLWNLYEEKCQYSWFFVGAVERKSRGGNLGKWWKFVGKMSDFLWKIDSFAGKFYANGSKWLRMVPPRLWELGRYNLSKIYCKIHEQINIFLIFLDYRIPPGWNCGQVGPGRVRNWVCSKKV